MIKSQPHLIVHCLDSRVVHQHVYWIAILNIFFCSIHYQLRSVLAKQFIFTDSKNKANARKFVVSKFIYCFCVQDVYLKDCSFRTDDRTNVTWKVLPKKACKNLINSLNNIYEQLAESKCVMNSVMLKCVHSFKKQWLTDKCRVFRAVFAAARDLAQ